MASLEGPEVAGAAGPAGSSAPIRSILFVCTGNTCRSPLAEALGKRLLADRLKCAPDELVQRGFVIRSAGVAATHGDAAAAMAVVVAGEFGADLSSHRSQPLNPELLASATDVIAMTQSHAQALAFRFPGIGPAPVLLCGQDPEIEDPIGGELEVYRECARTIARYLDRFVTEWAGS